MNVVEFSERLTGIDTRYTLAGPTYVNAESGLVIDRQWRVVFTDERSSKVIITLSADATGEILGYHTADAAQRTIDAYLLAYEAVKDHEEDEDVASDDRGSGATATEDSGVGAEAEG